jgi:hypothetical protein
MILAGTIPQTQPFIHGTGHTNPHRCPDQPNDAPTRAPTEDPRPHISMPGARSGTAPEPRICRPQPHALHSFRTGHPHREVSL